MSDSNEKICFIVAPISAPGSDTRIRSDQVLKHILRPILEEKGYKAIRADEIAEPGLINDQVIQHLASDPLVIADLTSHNPNVFYELAVRHATRLPVIHLIDDAELIPFDVSQSRTIKFNVRDLDSVEQCKEDLRKQILAIEASSDPMATPISTGIQFAALQQSKEPNDEASAAILRRLEQISLRLERLEANSRRAYQLSPGTVTTRAPSRPSPTLEELNERFRLIQESVNATREEEADKEGKGD